MTFTYPIVFDYIIGKYISQSELRMHYYGPYGIGNMIKEELTETNVDLLWKYNYMLGKSYLFSNPAIWKFKGSV